MTAPNNLSAFTNQQRAESAYVLSETEWLLRHGMNAHEIAAALNRTVVALEKLARRHNRPDLARPFQNEMRHAA